MTLFTMQDWLVETQDPGNGTAPVKARPALANVPTPRSLVFSYSSRFCSRTPAPRGGVTELMQVTMGFFFFHAKIAPKPGLDWD